MIKAKNAELIIFDVETTGLSPTEGDRIIEIAAIKIKDLKVVGVFESFINPKRELPTSAMVINKISEDMLIGAPTSAEFLPGIIDFIGGGCVVGHNVKFDLGFLCYELALNGRKLRDETPALDTLKMAKALIPYLSSYKLSHIAGALGITIGETHRAKADVELTIEVLTRLMDIAGDQDIHDLHAFCQQFSVEKPVYRMAAQVEQGFLF
jgi:DNA polymerase III epsilon subunit family exonuclease